MTPNLDQTDRRLISCLLKDGSLSQRELADQVGLSQNACWRRLKNLTENGVIRGSRVLIDPAALGQNLTVFVMIRTRQHSAEWSQAFRRHVEAIQNVVEFHRIGGDWDYMLKIVTSGMQGYDAVYRQLITGFELDTVTGLFSMEPIFSDRPPPLEPARRE